MLLNIPKIVLTKEWLKENQSVWVYYYELAWHDMNK